MKRHRNHPGHTDSATPRHDAVGVSCDRLALLERLTNALVRDQRRAIEDIAAIQRDLTRIAAALGATAAPPAPPPQPPAPLPYPSGPTLGSWVYATVYPHLPSGDDPDRRWCPQWWEHHDALTRLTALYLAYHALAHQKAPTWLSVFLRDHLDPHLAQLTHPHGPFRSCRDGHRNSTARTAHGPHHRRRSR
jgi:Domain of unknown function (DUF4913)